MITDMVITSLWFNFAVALAIGLLIGIERERSKGEGPTRRPAGIRTFALVSLLGAIAVHLGGGVLLAVATGGVAVLAALAQLRDRDPDPGMTTEIGLIVTLLLGGLAMSNNLLAAGLGAAIAGVFTVKTMLHCFIKRVLTEADVTDGLILAIATLVIWPLLPDRYLGPLQALNPHKLWLLVVLMMVIGACGHVAARALGPRFGLSVAGLASGFVSSIATIGSMAGRVAKDPASLNAAVAGAAFSTVATFVQMAVLLFTVSQPTLRLLAPALAAGAIIAAIHGLAFALRGATPSQSAGSNMGRAFSIAAALGLAALMAVMLVLAAALRDQLGESGIIIGATVAGFVDTHSAAISVASLAASDKIAVPEAMSPILAAMTSNALAKIVMAAGAGSGRFALRIIPGILLSIATAWAVMVWVGPA